MWVEELSVVVNFAGKIRVILVGRLENNLVHWSDSPSHFSECLVPIPN